MKCPKCQTELPDEANFCFNCGQKLDLKSHGPEPMPTVEAGRRRVTAIFSDLSGYTAMTEKLDPEEVKEITSSIFDGVREVVAKYEGFIEKFAGDGVLVLFGVPRAHEDDPIRAIRAVRDIHELVKALSPRYEIKVGRELMMHSGVNTGLAVTADVDIEKGTHSVTGDAINVAARLSDLANAGEVLVGHETYKANLNLFTFQPLKPVKVKGKSESILIFKLLLDKVGVSRPSPEIQVTSDMVGRDQELAKLELHILKAIDGQGSVVNVVGEPGIGKSRLLAELRQREVIRRVSFLEGRSISIGKNLSFHPIIDLFKQWAEIMEDDTQEKAANKLETSIRRVCGKEKDEVFPFVANMMGLKLSGKHSNRIEGIEGEALTKLLYKNLRELLIRSTKLAPIVIVMEDLHWADMTSLELLESIFRLALTYRIVFINVFRSGYWIGENRRIENLPQWFPEVDFSEIAIKPLDQQMAETLIDNIVYVKGLPYELKQQIVDRAGGNPFFIEEVVRSFIDDSAIISQNGAFKVTEKINKMVIPNTINDVLMARIDRLDDKTRNLVKVASVIGRSFFYRVLKEVLKTIEDIDSRLAYLKEIQLLRERRRMEELEYFFKHALAQETAYESILKQKRKELHLSIADSIEKVFQEKLHEFYGMLAYHFSRGEDLDKAEEYMVKAGEEALRSSASSEALNYCQEALGLYLNKYGEAAESEKIRMLETNIAQAFCNKGEYENALPYFENVSKSLSIKTSHNKIILLSMLVFNLLKVIINLYFPSKKLKRTPNPEENEIFNIRHKILLTLTFVNPMRQYAWCIETIKKTLGYDVRKIEGGYYFYLTGSGLFSMTGFSPSLSSKFLECAENIIDKKDFKELFDLNLYKTMHNCCFGNWDSFDNYNENLLDKKVNIGQLWEVSLYIALYCVVCQEQGKFEEAYTLIEKLSEIADSYEYEAARGNELNREARLLIQCRKLSDAQKVTEELEIFADNKSSFPFQLMSFAHKAQIQILLNDLAEAEKTLNKAEDLYKRQKFVSPLMGAHYLRTKLLYDTVLLEHSIISDNKPAISKQKKKAFQSGKNALKVFKKYAPYRTGAINLIGLYFWLIDKQSKAVKWWQKAIEEGERLSARPELARTYMEIGKRFLEGKSKYRKLNEITAEEYLEKARTMFKEMDLQWDLDQLNKIASNS
jgi:class 3 adenylate cyclase/tetratricopeptide (TPR) repeat protein